MEELSVSMVRTVYPRKMFAQLRKEGHEIVEKYPGIYYVKNNLLFPVQIIVTSELDPELHRSLRILTDRVEIEDVRQFLKEARTRNTPGERNDIDALLQASVAANYEVYEEIRRNSVMCEALRTLMKDEIELERQAGQKEGRKEGEAKIILRMNRNGFTAEQIAKATDKDVEEVKAILENREPALV
jgi:predicted transposase/invertase (TIGR01784 family)